MGERNQNEGVGLPVDGRDESAVSPARDAGENVPREARTEGIPASSQGDGSGDDRAREGNRHQGNPAVGDIGA
jgi:hypothetical protein